MRFALAIFANAIALCASIWWLSDSNWNTNEDIQIEPIVTTIALIAALLENINGVGSLSYDPLIKVAMVFASKHNKFIKDRPR